MRDKFHVNCRSTSAALVCLVLSSACLAVSSKITRHTSSSDLLKGQTEGIVRLVREGLLSSGGRPRC